LLGGNRVRPKVVCAKVILDLPSCSLPQPLVWPICTLVGEHLVLPDDLKLLLQFTQLSAHLTRIGRELLSKFGQFLHLANQFLRGWSFFGHHVEAPQIVRIWLGWQVLKRSNSGQARHAKSRHALKTHILRTRLVAASSPIAETPTWDNAQFPSPAFIQLTCLRSGPNISAQ
jgi:hypothetical protein